MTSTAKKPGRPPVGKQAMTTAEKKRAQRERNKELGLSQISFSIEGKHSETIKNLADILEVTKADAIRLLLLFGLKEAGVLTAEGQQELKILTSKEYQSNEASREAIQCARNIKRTTLNRMLDAVQSISNS